jgi:hypothetical protein
MDKKKKFRNDGFFVEEVPDNPVKTRLLNTLNEIRQENIRDGFTLEHKEQYNRKDLMPSVYDYDHVFIEWLIENDFDRLMKKVAGDDVELIHIAVVNSLPPGYMTTWHSDSYVEPIHKIIYYPSLDRTPSLRMEVLRGRIKGTGRLQYNKFIAKMEPRLYGSRKVEVKSTNDRCLFVNTQVMHRAMPVTDEPDAIRILFSFRKRFKSDQEINDYLKYTNASPEMIKGCVEKFRKISERN